MNNDPHPTVSAEPVASCGDATESPILRSLNDYFTAKSKEEVLRLTKLNKEISNDD